MESFQFNHLQAFAFSRKGLKHIAYVWEKAGFRERDKTKRTYLAKKKMYRRVVKNGFVYVSIAQSAI
jgi:hypothetical protein